MARSLRFEYSGGQRVDKGTDLLHVNNLNQMTGLSQGGGGDMLFEGTLSKPATNVTVNGVPATVDGANNWRARINVTPEWTKGQTSRTL